jgi:hypothetical protein
MKICMPLKMIFIIIRFLPIFLLIGCVTKTFHPGPSECPLNKIHLGDTYRDMDRVLGKPDRSQTVDRMGEELMILFIPIWNLIEVFGDFNPSCIYIYSYDRWGDVYIDNKNKIFRVEYKPKSK